MQIGLIGAGNMARALARGWGRPVLCADPYEERARASRRRSEGPRSRATRGSRTARTWSCCATSPPAARGRRRTRRLRRSCRFDRSGDAAGGPAGAYPARPVYRFIPSLPVEVAPGSVVQAAGPEQEPVIDAQVSELFASLRPWWCSTTAWWTRDGLMSCAPAVCRASSPRPDRRGVRRGIPAAQGAELVGRRSRHAELLRRRGTTRMAVRRESPHREGLTARGVDALEREACGLPFSDALDAVREER